MSRIRAIQRIDPGERNGRLKRLLADAMLDNVALKDLLVKEW